MKAHEMTNDEFEAAAHEFAKEVVEAVGEDPVLCAGLIEATAFMISARAITFPAEHRRDTVRAVVVEMEQNIHRFIAQNSHHNPAN